MEPQIEPIVIRTEHPSLVLRQITTEADDQAYFESVQASQDHLRTFEPEMVEKYSTLQAVTDARVNPNDPNKLRLAAWTVVGHREHQFVGGFNITPGEDEAKLGYWLDVRHTGYGYATFATRAIAIHAAQRYSRVFATTKPDNLKSQAVLERSAFSQVAPSADRLIFELDPPEPVSWREAIKNTRTLRPGQVVEGFEDMDEVDIFADNLGRHLQSYRRNHNPDKPLETYLVGSTGKRVINGWLTGSHPPSDAIRPKNFLGTFKNPRVVMLRDGESNHGLPTKNFIVFAEMHSSGVGFRGEVAKQCQIGTTVYRNSTPPAPGLVMAKYSAVKGKTPEAIADKIVSDSSETARKIMVNGLKHVLHGGLPGHGKKS